MNLKIMNGNNMTTNNTSSTFTTTTTTVNLSSITSTESLSKHHLSSQLFLTSASCQAISGTFAWVALLITLHHVN